MYHVCAVYISHHVLCLWGGGGGGSITPQLLSWFSVGPRLLSIVLQQSSAMMWKLYLGIRYYVS